MPARKKDNLINLLPKDKFSSTTTGQFLHWLLSTFRVIVIAVEMLVMIAFLSRFWLDARNSDLNKKIEQRKEQLIASQAFEKEFKQIQQRLGIYSALASQEKPTTTSFSSIITQLPPDVYISLFSSMDKDIKVGGFSPSEQSIAQFVVNLETVESFEEIALTDVDISKDREGLPDFPFVKNQK